MSVEALIILLIVQTLLILVGMFYVWKKIKSILERFNFKKGKINSDLRKFDHISQIEEQIKVIKDYMDKKNKK